MHEKENSKCTERKDTQESKEERRRDTRACNWKEKNTSESKDMQSRGKTMQRKATRTITSSKFMHTVAGNASLFSLDG